jgi:hypothetical protein
MVKTEQLYMSWIEMIKVQTAGRQAAEGCRNYLKALKYESMDDHGSEIRIYTHAAFPELQMIRLKWHSAHPEMPFSKISGVIIHELKQFGLVDHSIWVHSDSEPVYVNNDR